MNIERCWHVKSVQAKPNYFLRLEFENGERRVLDMAPMLNKRHFKALQDAKLFVAVKTEGGRRAVGAGDPTGAGRTLGSLQAMLIEESNISLT